ncbi:MFS transporter [Rhizomonospora bruguierae]|uniref:MFS transporter n=1 Tax=Rhizomonospora bruguierae TaxID=1581705 RepID=UPI001BD0489A|nr:MFS transporter [Micromonospora sp. NBRC 107566]
MSEASVQTGNRRWLLYLCLGTGVAQGVFGGTRVLVSYRTLALGGDAAMLGVVTALFALVPVLLAVWAGRAVDGRYPDLVLRGGMLLTAVSVAFIGLSKSIVALCLANVLMGTGQLLVVVASQGMVPLLSRPEDLDRNFSAWSLCVSAGQTVGLPLVGLVTVSTTAAGAPTATTPALLLLSGLCLTALFPMLLFRARAKKVNRGSQPPPQAIGAMLRIPALRSAMFTSVVILTSVDLVSVYLPLLGEQLGFSVLLVTTLLMVRTISAMMSRIALPAILARIPRGWLLVSSTLCAAAPMALLPWVGYPWMIGILLCIAGFFWGIGQPLTMAWVTSLVDHGNRAVALSVRLSGNRLGQVLVPLAAGAVASVAGVAAVFTSGGFLLAIAAGLTWRTAVDIVRQQT